MTTKGNGKCNGSYGDSGAALQNDDSCLGEDWAGSGLGRRGLGRFEPGPGSGWGCDRCAVRLLVRGGWGGGFQGGLGFEELWAQGVGGGGGSFEELGEVLVGDGGLAGEGGGVGGAVEGAEAVGLAGERGLELGEGGGGLVLKQEEFAEKLACGSQGAGGDGVLFGAVFKGGCALHAEEGFFRLVLREGEPCSDFGLLDFYLEGPVVFFGGDELFVGLGEGGEGGLDGGEISCVGGAEALGEEGHGFRIRVGAGVGGEGGGLSPLAALKRVAGGDGGGGEVCGGGAAGASAGLDPGGRGGRGGEHAGGAFYDGVGFVVLCLLEVGVDEVVIGVELIVALGGGAGRGGGGEVGGDGFGPRADAGEGVGGHVEGMGGIGCDFGVELGGVEGVGGERGDVVGVDDVVGEAGVIGIIDEEGFEDLTGLELAGVGFVSGRGGSGEGEGVEDCGFFVGGVGCAEGGHGGRRRR